MQNSKTIIIKSKLIGYLALSCVTFIAFMSPSLLFSLANDFYRVRLEMGYLAAFIPASLLLPLVRPRALGIGVLCVFMMMELVQFSHLFYFHIPLNVFALHLLMDNWGEVFESAKMALPWGLYHVFTVIFVYGSLIYFYLS